MFVLKWVINHLLAQTLIGRNRVAYHPEQGRFTRADVRRIAKDAWRSYDNPNASVPKASTVGARMNLQLACITLTFYQTLRAHNVSADDALEYISEAAWRIYRGWGHLPQVIAAALARQPLKRLRVATDLFRRFPFNPPAYLMEDIASEIEVAFHVHRCPVANYFLANDAGEVCVGVWCNQDYALAEQWGGKLKRDKTLAKGDDHCNFHWYVEGQNTKPETQSDLVGQ